MHTQAKLFDTVPDCKGQFEIFKGFPHAEDLKGDPTMILSRDDSHNNVGIVLTPYKGSLCEEMFRQELDDGFRNEIEKLRDNELGSLTGQLK